MHFPTDTEMTPSRGCQNC